MNDKLYIVWHVRSFTGNGVDAELGCRFVPAAC